MALLVIEGFDGYNSKTDFYDNEKYFEEVSGTPTFVTGRSGSGKAINLAGITTTNVFLPAQSTDTIFMGFAIRINAGTDDYPIFEFYGYPNSTLNNFVVNYGASPRRISIGRYSTNHLVETPELNLGQWYYISFDMLINNSAGSITLYLDGVQVDSVSGVDTLDTSGNTNVIRFVARGTTSGGLDFDIDDLYFGDNSGTDLTAQVGDVSIEQLVPDGAGSSSQFTPSAGSNYQNVDELTPDGDTTYNSSNTVGHKDLFTCSNLSTTPGTVYAVQLDIKANKQDVGTRTYKPVIKSNATEGDGSEQGLTDGSYKTKSFIYENDPDGGGSWSGSSVDAMEIGYKVVQ